MPANEPIYVTDLGLSRPQKALSTDRRKYHWQVVPYETAEFSGKMLIAGPETEAASGHGPAWCIGLAPVLPGLVEQLD